MGVPKFFRYISERYPCLSEFVQEYQIPDFDNLYLDMNGIIHNCSHPDDNNPHFRITEEKIFQDIFHYIEILFQMIKPSKVFFMAVDGVAPRAKMNQQRGRRFRSAKDALKLENEAIKRGEKLPTESRFDSNCITPGTEFMAKLQEQLQYFVVKKVSEDPLWQRCKIILSGHETPGEGEHKIMDFIRYKRSQPDYDPNTRHCLYGLDADLIMLGLCTHDPHFSLLREEVKFGKKAKKTCVPEEIRFYLLHLSLMREYLELEFSSLKGTLKNFEFDIEKIIDDWVLMGFLVGNDFIPNLPNLHITNGALPVLYGAYMDILPKLDGYINEGGILNLERFEIFMKKLGEIDLQNFEEVRDDLLYMEAKTGRKMVPFSKHNVTKFRDLEEWKPEECVENSELLKPLEEEKKYKDSGLMDLIAATEKEYLDDENEELTEEEEEESDEDYSFRNYKKNYYMNKLEYSKVTSDVMKSQAEGYVRAIQWNLHYYYNGVCSWSWYYPHHYSPYISDIKNFKDLELTYDIGKPFMPYEQLLAVLPAASKKLLPKCYQNLMTDENSPIKIYYPEDFETDLNGKKQEWEAVVLVPFIDEKILLDSMDKCSEELSVSEVERNKHSPMLCYSYVQEDLGVYKAPMYFPTIPANHAKLETISIGDISVPLEKLVKGAYPGVLMDVYYPGFPTFKHLDYTGNLKKAKVKVFDQPSLGENMVIQVIPTERVLNATIPLELLGKTVYVGWPHLIEATVMELMSSTKKYIYGGVGKDPIEEPSPVTFNHEVENMINHYFGRLGIEFGKTIIVVKAKKMIGQKYLITAGNKISLEKIFSENLTNYPLQLIVEDIQVYGEFRELCPTLESLFPVGSSCFCLTHNKFYGSKCIIKSSKENSEQTVCVNVIHSQEPNLSKAKYLADISERKYKNLYMASEECSMPSYLFSRITGCVFASARNKEGGLKNVNFGLDLKYNKKNLETPDYTKRINGVWYYTDKTIDAVYAYANAFPEIFDYLFENSKQKRDTSVEDIFSEDSDEKTKLVLSWLKSQPFNQIEKRPCNSNILDNEVVDEIEKAVLGVEKIEPKEIEMSFKATFLYKSELCFGNMLPDQHVEVQLLDRIVNVRPNYTVPFGLKGTVIGIRASSAETSSEFLYDVLFDDKFEGGIDVNSSLGKGYRLPLNSFINISHGVRLYQANKERKPRTSFSNHNRRDEFVPNKYQNFTNHNKITNHYVNSPHSAFAKFNNQQTCGLPSYNAVPPYMPNNEYIYKSDNFQFQNNRRNYNPHNQNNYSKKEENVNIKIMKRPTNSPKSGANLNNKGFKKQTLYRDSENNVNVDSSNFENMSKKQDFMPAFRKEAPSVDVQETADALKKILKISTDVEKKDCKVRQIVYNSPLNVPNNNQKENTLQHKKTDGVEKIEKRNSSNKETLSSVELFNYYQCKGLGLPRYQYITTSDKRIQSQIKLPNRQIIIGQAASTRLEATEFVAKEALKILSDDGNVKSIPSPPKQWWALETDKKIVNNTTKNTSEKDVWKKFIPLQVTKKKNVNSNSTAMQSTMSSDNKKLHQTSNEKAKNSSKDNAQATKKRERKPKKMRIAANFALSPSSQDK